MQNEKRWIIEDVKEWTGMSQRQLMDIVHAGEQWKMVVNHEAVDKASIATARTKLMDYW